METSRLKRKILPLIAGLIFFFNTAGYLLGGSGGNFFEQALDTGKKKLNQLSGIIKEKNEESHGKNSKEKISIIYDLDSDKKIDYFKDMTAKEVIKEIDTPIKAQYYLDSHLTYGNPLNKNSSSYEVFSRTHMPDKTLFLEYQRTFTDIHKIGKGKCLDYAIAAATLLKDDGYPPKAVICLEKGKEKGHVFFLFEYGSDNPRAKYGKYGAVGVGCDPRMTEHNLADLVMMNGYDNYKLEDISEQYLK